MKKKTAEAEDECTCFLKHKWLQIPDDLNKTIQLALNSNYGEYTIIFQKIQNNCWSKQMKVFCLFLNNYDEKHK